MGRVTLAAAETGADQDRVLRLLARTGGTYDVAPLSTEWFEPGAQRIYINVAEGGGLTTDMVPPEERHRVVMERCLGPDDVETKAVDEDWSFEWELAGVKENFGSFPLVSESHSAYANLYRELDEIMAGGRRVKGVFPVNLILATRAY